MGKWKKTWRRHLHLCQQRCVLRLVVIWKEKWKRHLCLCCDKSASKKYLQPVILRKIEKINEFFCFFFKIRLKALGRRINVLREDGSYLTATTMKASLRITNHLVLVYGISRMEMSSMEISSKMLSKTKW